MPTNDSAACDRLLVMPTNDPEKWGRLLSMLKNGPEGWGRLSGLPGNESEDDVRWSTVTESELRTPGSFHAAAGVEPEARARLPQLCSLRCAAIARASSSLVIRPFCTSRSVKPWSSSSIELSSSPGGCWRSRDAGRLRRPARARGAAA